MKLTCTFLFILFTITLNAQISLKGNIADTSQKKDLSNTVISLLTPKDSILYKFTRADSKGYFSFDNIQPGNYILMITHPYYADYLDNLDLKKESLKLDLINLTPKSKLLKEVIVKTGSPIRIKGDTTEFTADSFKVKENANVEDLLRKMPGIQVDKNGEIKAMGEKVTKVLVDGEEFFGDDPGIATKNIRADAVDKVQVFDKKSDQATFTGIDDGKKDKTINLKLKENKKNGYFGKATIAGGLPDYYGTSVMANAFKGKRKLAGYGMMGNTGKYQLNWKDNTNYGGNDMVQTEFDDATGNVMMFWDGNNSGDDFANGQNGVPVNKNVGVHFNTKSADLKQSVNSGYKFAQLSAHGNTKVYSKIFLPDTSYNTASNSNTYLYSIKHAGNIALDFNLDSSNTLRYVAKINNKHNQSITDFYSESTDDKGNFINKSNQHTANTSDNNALSTSLLWKHKYKKKFRTLSMNVAYDGSEIKNNGFLFSQTNFFKPVAAVDSIDQRNINNLTASSITSKLAYTEPLFKDAFMEFSYSFNYYNNNNDKISKKGINGKYDQIIDSLTNTYQFTRVMNSPGLNFRYNKKKINYSLGTGLGFNNYQQKNITTGVNISRDFTTVMPRASITYKLKPSSQLRFNYIGNSVAPSLDQLQPIKNNNDPLNIYEGNPLLKQAFHSNYSLSYNFWNLLKQTNFWSSVSYQPVQNAFVNSSIIDKNGIRHYSTVNTNGPYNFNMYTNYGMKLMKSGWYIGLGPSANISRNIEFINAVQSITQSSSYGVSIYTQKEKEKKYNIWCSTDIQYYNSSTSTNKNYDVKYLQVSGNLNGTIYFHHGFEFDLENEYEYRQKDPRFPTNSNRIISNAGFKEVFMKNTMELSFMVYDLLNQNTGYNRNFGSYNYKETYYTTLKRYGMVSLTWNFNKNGAKPSGF